MTTQSASAKPYSDQGEGMEFAAPVYDKTGREILVGDVLKVYHFTGRRKKRHFMYKQVADTVRLGQGANSSPYFFVAHLDMSGDGYHLPRDGSHLPDYEIVQSIDASFEDRPRVTAPSTSIPETGA